MFGFQPCLLKGTRLKHQAKSNFLILAKTNRHWSNSPPSLFHLPAFICATHSQLAMGF